MTLNKKNCAICGIELTIENKKSEDIYAFNLVCLEHEKYATVFLIEIVKQNLGIISVSLDTKCAVCEKKLNDKECQESLKYNSFHLLCANHLKEHFRKYDLTSCKIKKK